MQACATQSAPPCHVQHLGAGLGLKHPLQLERASHRDRQALALRLGAAVEQLIIVTTQLLTATHAHLSRCLQVSCSLHRSLALL